MTAAAPVLNLSSNTKGSMMYFRDLFKTEAGGTGVCVHMCVCVCACVYAQWIQDWCVKPLVLGKRV